MRPVLILGGYGNFGKRIARALVRDKVPVIIAGRNREKAEQLLAELDGAKTEISIFDVREELREKLFELKPAVVVNTCGPFQEADYGTAKACIDARVPYIDLADARDFVVGITALDAVAKENNTVVISGASSVPGLSSAVIEAYRTEFSKIRSLTYGISPGQKTERGRATTEAILSYVGKKLASFPGTSGPVYGWQDLYRQDYPVIGRRWMANCDIPDLDLLPASYEIDKIRFSAGLELIVQHFGLWLISWLIRAGIPLDLPKFAGPLLAVSNFLDIFGTGNSGMHMILEGIDLNGKPHTRRWFIIAQNSDGPNIPTIPAIVLARRLAKGEAMQSGATACIGLLSLDEYLAELKHFEITTFEEAD